MQQNAGAAEERSSTAEELASQAEQLQGTIAFFKMHETEKELMRRTAPAAQIPAQNVHPVRGTAQRAGIGLEEKHHKRTGVVLNMGSGGNGKDDRRDAEFEQI